MVLKNKVKEKRGLTQAERELERNRLRETDIEPSRMLQYKEDIYIERDTEGERDQEEEGK